MQKRIFPSKVVKSDPQNKHLAYLTKIESKSLKYCLKIC